MSRTWLRNPVSIELSKKFGFEMADRKKSAVFAPLFEIRLITDDWYPPYSAENPPGRNSTRSMTLGAMRMPARPTPRFRLPPSSR